MSVQVRTNKMDSRMQHHVNEIIDKEGNEFNLSEVIVESCVVHLTKAILIP